jgi:hypothetical protein
MGKVLPCCVVALFFFAALGSADLVTPRKAVDSQTIRGFTTRSTLERYKPNEGAMVILSGKLPSTVLNLYVFDAQGNCVAMDDRTTPQNSVDLSLEWVPAEQTPYFVEVRNAGLAGTQYDVVLR